MGKHHRSRRVRVVPHRLLGTAWEGVVIVVVLAIVGVVVAVLAAGNDGGSSEQQTSAGSTLATVGSTATTVGGTLPINPTGVFDPGIATHIALLTATPQPIATKPSDPMSQVPTPDPNAEPEPTLVAGLSEVQQAPFSPAEFLVRNHWQGPVGSNTRWMMVWAGAKKNMETDGSVGPAAVRVYEFTTTPEGRYAGNVTELGLFTIPAVTGPLTIVAVNGSLFELRTDGGETVQFNVTTLDFQ